MDKPKPDTPPHAFGNAEFHAVAQKQLAHAAQQAIGNAKLNWETVAPLLEAARAICRADICEGASIRLHTEQEEAGNWVEAEEAFLGISLADRDDGTEWLSETWWISDLALAEEDPARINAIARALERSVARIDAWLAANEKGGGTEAPPPDPS
jgi:hypothetical protein